MTIQKKSLASSLPPLSGMAILVLDKVTVLLVLTYILVNPLYCLLFTEIIKS